MEIQVHEECYKKHVSSNIFITGSFNETKTGLLSSLHLEKVIILTIFF